MLSRSSAFALVALSLSTLANAGAARGSEKRTSTSQPGQQGYNDCGTTNSQTSECQTAVVNSVTDFCLWAPPTYGPTIGDSEEYEVAWCTQDGHGTRTMPAGTIQSAHYLVTPHYTQVTGTGDFTKINILAGDSGGELDPHGADGNGNPIGALVYNNGVAIQEWTSFISDTEFCFRVCHETSDAWLWCQHIYDLQGCAWNEPGNYGSGFDQCEGDSTEYPPGIYVENGVTSTYQQGDGSNPAPTAHAAGASSNCQAVATVGGGVAIAVTTPAASTTTTSKLTTSTTTSNTAAASSSSLSAAQASSSSAAAAASASSYSSSSSAAAAASYYSSSSSSAAAAASSFSSSSSAAAAAASSANATSAAANSTTSAATSPVSTHTSTVVATSTSPNVAAAAATTSTASGAEKVVIGGLMGVVVAVVGLLA